MRENATTSRGQSFPKTKTRPLASSGRGRSRVARGREPGRGGQGSKERQAGQMMEEPGKSCGFHSKINWKLEGRERTNRSPPRCRGRVPEEAGPSVGRPRQWCGQGEGALGQVTERGWTSAPVAPPPSAGRPGVVTDRPPPSRGRRARAARQRLRQPPAPAGRKPGQAERRRTGSPGRGVRSSLQTLSTDLRARSRRPWPTPSWRASRG